MLVQLQVINNFIVLNVFTYNDVSNTVLLQISGTFSNNTDSNPTSGVKQLKLNSAFYLATSTTALTTRSVTLRAID